MRWSIKAIAGSPKDLMNLQFSIIASVCIMLLYSSYISWDLFMEDHEFFLTTTLCGVAVGAYLISAMRQKTIYRYQIYNTRATLVYRLNFPKYATTLFKGLAFLGIFISLLIGLMTGSLLFLLGPGAIAFIAALRLLTWKNPIKRETSLPWHEYNFVTVDRKRRFIVTHVSDLTLGFEARLPDDALFEQYLAFLHSVLPATAQFTEKEWDMSLI